MHNKTILITILTTLFAIFLAQQSLAEQNITSCVHANNETTNKVVVSINSTGNCLTVNQSNMLIFCSNVSNPSTITISGKNDMGGPGFNMTSIGINITNKVNVTVQDCRIQYFAWGIFATNVSGLRLVNVTYISTYVKNLETINVSNITYGGHIDNQNSNYTLYNGTDMANGTYSYINNTNLVFDHTNFTNTTTTVTNSSLNQQGTFLTNSTITCTNSNSTFNQSTMNNAVLDFDYAELVRLYNSTFSGGTVVNITNGSVSQIEATYRNSSLNVINVSYTDFNISTVANGSVNYYYSNFVNFFNSTFSQGTYVNVTNGSVAQIAAMYMGSHLTIINATQTDFNRSIVFNGSVTYQNTLFVNFFGSNFSAGTSVNITNGSVSQIEAIYRNSSLNMINASSGNFSQSYFYNTTSVMRNLVSFYMFNSSLEGGTLNLFNTTNMADLVNLTSTSNTLVNVTTATRIANSSFENGSTLTVTNAQVVIVDSHVEGYNLTSANLSIARENSVEVNFTTLITGTNNTNLSQIINMTNETISINSSFAPYFNTTARITFEATIADVGLTEPKIDMGDGRGFVACPTDVCTNVAITGASISFDVTHFSGFGFGGKSGSAAASSGGRGPRTYRAMKVIKKNPVLVRPKLPFLPPLKSITRTITKKTTLERGTKTDSILNGKQKVTATKQKTTIKTPVKQFAKAKTAKATQVKQSTKSITAKSVQTGKYYTPTKRQTIPRTRFSARK